MMNLEVVSGCRGVCGDLFWEGSVGCELRVLRYHYITPQQNFTQENLERKVKTQRKKWGLSEGSMG
jgi:hypothetical protein